MNDSTESEPLQQFQNQWHEHSRRLEALVGAAPRLVGASFSASPIPRWMPWVYALLALFSAALAVYWAHVAPPFAYTLLRIAFAVAFGLLLLAMSLGLFLRFVVLLLSGSARVSPLLIARLASLLPSPRLSWGGPFAVRYPQAALRLRPALLALFLIATLVATACTPPADAYCLTQSNLHSYPPAEIINLVTNLIVPV